MSCNETNTARCMCVGEERVAFTRRDEHFSSQDDSGTEYILPPASVAEATTLFTVATCSSRLQKGHLNSSTSHLLFDPVVRLIESINSLVFIKVSTTIAESTHRRKMRPSRWHAHSKHLRRESPFKSEPPVAVVFPLFQFNCEQGLLIPFNEKWPGAVESPIACHQFIFYTH